MRGVYTHGGMEEKKTRFKRLRGRKNGSNEGGRGVLRMPKLLLLVVKLEI